jgi:hypothetical protein
MSGFPKRLGELTANRSNLIYTKQSEYVMDEVQNSERVKYSISLEM